MSAKNGGPEFPYGYGYAGFEPGMSLRDYFAAAALTGLLANPGYNLTAKIASEEASLQADAMLAERAKERE